MLAAVPALVEAVLELRALRALRMLLVLLTTEGMEGTGSGILDEGIPDDAYSDGKTEDACSGSKNGAVCGRSLSRVSTLLSVSRLWKISRWLFSGASRIWVSGEGGEVDGEEL